MNRRAIGIIIGLMAAATIGIVALQFSLIQNAVAVKEAEFRQDVFNVLETIKNYIETESQKENSNLVNGYSIKHYKESKESLLLDNLKKKFGEYTQENTIYQKDVRELYFLVNQPIEERIKVNKLDEFVKQTLSDKGIRTKADYGVFSVEENAFVIHDGMFAYPDAKNNNDIEEGFVNLHNTEYKVNLFNNPNPLGQLHIDFPNSRGYVWQKLWLNILGLLLFTGLMLFCFAYTINVVFKQKKLSEMKTDFMNNMTHEFKTPIATISLAVDSISSPKVFENPERLLRFAKIIKQENRRMNSQVEKVLQMASLDKDDFNLRITTFDLHEIIRQAVTNIGLQVEPKGGKAYADLKASNYSIEGDFTHVSNIVNNLLDNANKYSPEQPEISIHTRNVPNGIELIVKDNGVGMTKEARKHIFDKFYRVHTGDLHDVKGFGLGLSYVKAMMIAHKGTIDVKSDLGKGSSFMLFFPFKHNKA